jgi:hypothetical protein
MIDECQAESASKADLFLLAPAVSGIGHFEKFAMILHVSKMTLRRRTQK